MTERLLAILLFVGHAALCMLVFTFLMLGGHFLYNLNPKVFKAHAKTLGTLLAVVAFVLFMAIAPMEYIAIFVGALVLVMVYLWFYSMYLGEDDDE